MTSMNEEAVESTKRMMKVYRKNGFGLPRVKAHVGDEVILKHNGEKGVITSDWDSSPEAESCGRYGLDKWFISEGTNTHVIYSGDFDLVIEDHVYIERYIEENSN